MAWFKVDDQFHASRKLNSIPKRHRLQAAGLWAIAGSWVSGQETDGFVPDYMIQVWSPTQKTVDSLVESGLWIRENDGFRFYSWLNYNPSKEDSDAKRAASKERMRQSRERNRRRTEGKSRNQTSEYAGNGAADEDVTLQHPNVTGGTLQRPDPTRPDPTPITTNVVIKESAPAEPEKPKKHVYSPEFETWWKIYPNSNGKAAAEKAWEKASEILGIEELNRLTAHYARLVEARVVNPQYVPYGSSWLNGRRWEDGVMQQDPNAAQPTVPGRLSNAEVARQLQERNAQDQAQQRELSNAEALEAWMQDPKAIGF